MGSRALRVGPELLLREDDRLGVSTEEMWSVANDSPKEGMESTETVRMDNADPTLLSLMLMSSSMRCSGGVRSISIVPRLRDQLNSFSDTWRSSKMSST